ncbi:hypothetical protein [Kribbella sandramycini]|uniref:Uncharacterized protein n=1 Tax=Kribbella sandramycini TaxID=60450 RepID=A0A841SLH7_9ACTN|nr:hypothetical protein [Kribbella sandramycini]MBB6569822.1 hypothetical protein [Kribbella sandramycini]
MTLRVLLANNHTTHAPAARPIAGAEGERGWRVLAEVPWAEGGV